MSLSRCHVRSSEKEKGRHIGNFWKQGRIHGRISRVRLGRSSDAKTARKTPKKQMRYRRTDGPTNGPTQWGIESRARD